MAISAPSARVRSSFSGVPAVVKTRAPAAFASWMAALPTPLALEWISTVCPACSPPSVNRFR